VSAMGKSGMCCKKRRTQSLSKCTKLMCVFIAYRRCI
jgi:hypothetical protein